MYLFSMYVCVHEYRVREGGREGGVGLTMLDDQIFCILMKGVAGPTMQVQGVQNAVTQGQRA